MDCFPTFNKPNFIPFFSLSLSFSPFLPACTKPIQVSQRWVPVHLCTSNFFHASSKSHSFINQFIKGYFRFSQVYFTTKQTCTYVHWSSSWSCSPNWLWSDTCLNESSLRNGEQTSHNSFCAKCIPDLGPFGWNSCLVLVSHGNIKEMLFRESRRGNFIPKRPELCKKKNTWFG